MAERPPPKMGPGRRVVFRPNHSKKDGFGGYILSDTVRDMTVEVAADIMDLAENLTPRGRGENGHMRNKYRIVREAGTIKVSGNIRVKVEIHNDDPESALVEFGSQHNPRRRMLGQAGAAFGDFKHPGEGPLRNDGTF